MRARPSFAVGLLSLVAFASPARADERSVIKVPGDHPRYAFEAEPEAIVPFDAPLSDGPGLGFRGAVPLEHNGFVSSINDSPAIGFGVSRTPIAAHHAPLATSVVLQWNFWMTTHLSVFGEAGAFVFFGDGDRNPYLHPALMGGGRFHFTERVALTARISLPGSPSLGIGVSFLL